MGADVLYLSPCCKSEAITCNKDGSCKCDICNEVFLEPIEDVLDYDNE